LIYLRNIYGSDLNELFRQAGATPHILQTDNFTSFSGGAFENYLQQHRIRHVFSKTYSPQSNGTVENANGQIRKKLRDLFLRQNNFRWYDQLHYIQESWNTTRHGTTKQRPVDLYFDHGNDELQDEVYGKLRDRADNLLAKYRAKQFNENDWVRVSMVALDSQVRRAHKEGKIKNVVALWSKTKYQINHIVRNRLANWQYSIKDRFGRPVIAHREPALFFASELLATNPYDPLFDDNPNLAINVAQLNRFANSNVNPNQQLPAPNQIPLHTRAGVIQQGPIALRTRGRGGGRPLLRLRGGANENDSEEED